MDNSFAQVVGQLPEWFRSIADSVPAEQRGKINELRLFAGQPAVWRAGTDCFCYDSKAITPQKLEEIFYAICRGSVHSFQQEICQGFVTMEGGHRVGICGTAVFHNGQQSGLRDISSLNIRFARQAKGCARALYRRMNRLGLAEGSFLLAGPPGCGKTTLLRDYARILAGGDGGMCRIVALLDERGELSGGFDLGRTAHVLKAIPKEKAILQALRTLAPQVILCDELGTEQETNQLIAGLNGGCRFIGSIHGENWASLCRKPQFRPLLEQQALDGVVFLEGLGQIREIYLRKEERHACAGLWADFCLSEPVGTAP